MSTSATYEANVSVLDIRREELECSILSEMKDLLRPAVGKEKKMPTMLLYDEQGLKLFEDITYLDEYYPTNAEIEILSHYAHRIAERIEENSQIIELGSGNLRKVAILLRALDAAGKAVDYYALDLSLSELTRTLSAVPSGTFEHVRCHGLLGTYDDGLEWLKLPENSAKSTCIMWLGSSIGNLNCEESASFLRRFTSVLGPEDSMLIAIDGCLEKDKVYHAYNDQFGKTHEFIRNGLVHANALLGKDVFLQADWDVLGEYDEEAERHQAFYVARKNLHIDGIDFVAGEKVRVEESYKYSSIQREQLWEKAGLTEGAVWGDKTGTYHIHMLSVPSFNFPLNPTKYAPEPVPSLKEFEQLWASWDLVTQWMIPHEELLSKPIKLRNCCLFYLGHIPTFLDIHLTRAIGGVPTEPSAYRRIFERGIDPDVDNPELCHAHSEIPDSWPPIEEILRFQDNVRERTRCILKNLASQQNAKVARALWIGFEHEAMHLETLLYMLLQSETTIPPPGVWPDFQALADEAKVHEVDNEWFTIPSSNITLGLQDPENDNPPKRFFGWDNERPPHSVHVATFQAKARAITNAEYVQYLQATGKSGIPASWTRSSSESSTMQKKATSTNGTYELKAYINGGMEQPSNDSFTATTAVRTVYRPVPLKYALHWPVMASYDELLGCTKWMGGRIPTQEEVRSIYSYVAEGNTKDEKGVHASTIPAVNGHLSNDGVEETPPSDPSRRPASSPSKVPDPTTLFANLEGCNVGFKHFHPMPITQNGKRLSGQAQMGGVWEWTSSVLESYEGFKSMDLYPGYTADFFDTKHNIMLGGSWATHPRIAGRKTFVNWYQRNYPYVWAGARIVRDL